MTLDDVSTGRRLASKRETIARYEKRETETGALHACNIPHSDRARENTSSSR